MIKREKIDQDLLAKLNQAQNETLGCVETFECEECSSLFGPEAKRITEKYCADCYKEIKWGLIPAPKRSLRY